MPSLRFPVSLLMYLTTSYIPAHPGDRWGGDAAGRGRGRPEDRWGTGNKDREWATTLPGMGDLAELSKRNSERWDNGECSVYYPRIAGIMVVSKPMHAGCMDACTTVPLFPMHPPCMLRMFLCRPDGWWWWW
jgi:hypothetical protein